MVLFIFNTFFCLETSARCTISNVRLALGNHFKGAVEVVAKSERVLCPQGTLISGQGSVQSVLISATRRGRSTPTAASTADDRPKTYMTKSKIQLPLSASDCADPITWRTFPGLFAGGGVDVMTKALLGAPGFVPPEQGRVLDFACGSGCIAAALRLQQPSTDLTIHTLDGDACALHACKKNVPGIDTNHCYLTSGWLKDEHKERVVAKNGEAAHIAAGSEAFDWVVSNPPVHAGQPDDFRVVSELIAGAPSRLVRHA